ncbi:alpha/beta hydrolase [Kamptonema formosum]|uniref:alpha/beta hydrolase n=1 Tax=Kamptonema formosum TaxID=331992 RepID=UPI0003485877|nr:alpha/beta fold hydrolase [Oscillatoria sp. PCC 10802]
MSNYSQLTSAIIQETEAREDARHLMDETCPSRFFLHPSPTNKVCLFFHGFTATPEQFVPLGEAFFNAGCNVLIPLQPGHGIAGSWDGNNPPPLPEDPQIYQDFALEWLEIARQMGKKVVTGGLSSGGTLAAWLALERPEEISQALLFAPYLSGSNKWVDWFVRLFNIYFEWKTQLGRVRFGYKGFRMRALRIFLDMGERVLKRAKKSFAAPMLIVSSDSDAAVGKEDHEALFEAALKFQPKTWYHCFERGLDIPHTMMTKAEGNSCIDLLIALAKAYVGSDLTWAEVEGIGERMREGYSFETAVKTLHLSQRVSRELPAIVTRLAPVAKVG